MTVSALRSARLSDAARGSTSSPGQTGLLPDLANSSDTQLFGLLRTSDRPAREQITTELVARYAWLVRWLSARYAGRGAEKEELRQVAYLGLMNAVARFDPDHARADGTAGEFKHFAIPTVEGELRRHFRDKRRWIRLPRRVQDAKSALARADGKLHQELGRAPTTDELCRATQLEESIVVEALRTPDGYVMASLNAPASPDGTGPALVEMLGSPDQRLELVVDAVALLPLLEKLSAREKTILRLRFWEDRTQEEIGREVGISQMHVSRLLRDIMRRLRQDLLGNETAIGRPPRAAG